MLKFRSLLASLFVFFSSIFFPALALAQGAPAAAQSGFMSFLPLIAIFVIFYFLLIRPQQKKFKEHQAMIESLKIGNEVYTSSGIVGKIKEIDAKENLIFLEIANGVVVKILKGSVSQVVDNKKDDKKDAKVDSANSKKNKKSKK